MRALLLASVLILASGCASTPLKHYPEFPERYAETTRTRLVTDVVIAEDIGGSVDRVTVSRNRELGRMLADSLASWLTARGYAVDEVAEPAVGLFYTDRPVRVREAEGDPDSLLPPPFFLDPSLASDSALVAGVDLDLPAYASGDSPEARVLLTVRARDVPLGKTCAQGVLTGVLTSLLTGGLVSAYAYENSVGFVAVDIFDSGTGEWIWHDQVEAPHGATRPALRDLLRKLVRRLPERPLAPAATASVGVLGPQGEGA